MEIIEFVENIYLQNILLNTIIFQHILWLFQSEHQPRKSFFVKGYQGIKIALTRNGFCGCNFNDNQQQTSDKSPYIEKCNKRNDGKNYF